MIWFAVITSVVIVSFVSFLGIISLYIRKSTEKMYLLVLIGFSAGTLFGDSLLHLLPEITKKHGFTLEISLLVLLGIIVFFILEKFIHLNHCHNLPITEKHENHNHHVGALNLAGDALHNFLDGLLIAGSYLISFPLGIATTIAVVAHEIPQEFADFGILLYSGISKEKALFLNFLSALTAVAGAIIGLILGLRSEIFVYTVVPFTAGAFLYIAGSNLIPELQKDSSLKNSLIHIVAVILGIGIMIALLFL